MYLVKIVVERWMVQRIDVALCLVYCRFNCSMRSWIGYFAAVAEIWVLELARSTKVQLPFRSKRGDLPFVLEWMICVDVNDCDQPLIVHERSDLLGLFGATISIKFHDSFCTTKVCHDSFCSSEYVLLCGIEPHPRSDLD